MMRDITIKTSELIYLNEAAKALKKKRFIIFYNNIIACDNLSYLSYVTLDSDIFYNPYLSGLVVETRELSAFVKTITTESCFTSRTVSNGYVINTITGNLKFTFSNIDIGKLFKAPKPFIICEEECINDKIPEIFEIRRHDGSFNYIHHGKYFMTLFYGILPLSKADKIYLTIREGYTINSFIAEFRVSKKKFDVNVVVAYLYI